MKYFAFISFQNSDAKWALWIQKQIEAYRLPIALSKQRPDLPRKIKPCFCYLSDISLKEELMMDETYMVGEKIKVTDGPFNGFNGVISEVLQDKHKLKVEVTIFDRQTPLELGFNQVEKE